MEGGKNSGSKLNRFESLNAEIAKHGCGEVTTAFPSLQYVQVQQTIEHLDRRAWQNGSLQRWIHKQSLNNVKTQQNSVRECMISNEYVMSLRKA